MEFRPVKRPKMRMRRNGTNRWSKEDKNLLLELVISMIKHDTSLFEKPTASLFYQRIIDKFPNIFAGYGWRVMRDKMRNLRAKYCSAIFWRANTGKNIDGPDADLIVRQNLIKHCEDFDMLDIIFAGRDLRLPAHLLKGENSTEVHVTEEEFLEFSQNDTNQCTLDENSSSNFKFEDTTTTTCRAPADIITIPESISVENEPEARPPQQLSVPKKQRKETDAAAFLAKVSIRKLDYLKEKLEHKKSLAKEKLKLEWAQFEHQKRHDAEEVRLKEQQLQNNFEIEKQRLQHEMKLKEMELKFKYGKE